MSQNCTELDKIITQSQSTNKQLREQAQATISALRLDGGTTPVLFEYVTQETMFNEQNRLAVAVIIKNIVKKVYGVSMADLKSAPNQFLLQQHSYTNYDEAKRKFDETISGDPEDDPSTFIDPAGIVILQQNLVPLIMGCPSRLITLQFLEMLSLMGKRFVQNEWPSLIPELASYLAIDPTKPHNLQCSKLALEAIKKICKKYRYMFRSDDLYREMNYMIENLSHHLLSNLIFAVSTL